MRQRFSKYLQFTLRKGKEMGSRTVESAHSRIDNLEKEVVMIKTEVKIQFKDLFGRVKRLEAILIAATGAILIVTLTVLAKMP